ncbi:hypothetical protein SI65_04833 [Aspergillus cristatus]|uniref:protein-histidine N-methyltransferase n=1 Tax=Aspergillus cristatus TaxID=573508 RepID=A0A1E3BG07_ASPCR|nr:hypothetical protein SI65_04833 [Aspergillus cristatus]
MAFSFGFSGDDIDIDDSEVEQPVQVNSISAPVENDLPESVAAKRHEMGEWLQLNTGNGHDDLTIARREVFDIRTQLMAEDSEQDNEELISGLEHGDLKPNFYEGGFKTWECALDLAKRVVGDGAVTDVDGDYHIIEVGAGTAVPSLALFARLLSASTQQRKTHFTFADYNAVVLRLVTLPNLLLTWNQHREKHSASTNAPSSEQQEPGQEEEELDVTPELLEEFQKDLAKRGITIDFISGAWSPAFVDLAFSNSPSGNHRTLVLASETIYSPLSLGAFTETLLELLRRSGTTESKSKALIAAKKVYFGVGGGVNEFLAVLRNTSGDEMDVKKLVDVKSEGVGRVVLEVTQAGGIKT